MNTPRIIIIGLGIGGASTALALEKAGLDYLILEQASQLGEVGAGLQMSPNASRIMDWLGLADELKTIAVEPQAHLFLDGLSAKVLMQTPLMPEVQSAFGAPYYHVHRADLLRLLTSHVDMQRVRLSTQVRAVRQTDHRVYVELTDDETLEADVVIGADGIRSVIRQQVFNPAPPAPSGCIAWRALVPVDKARELGFERNSYVWMGPQRSVVMYYVRAGELFNWVGITPYDGQREESWSAQAPREAALGQYAGWHEQVTSLIDASQSLFVTAISDRAPLDNWVNGRIALMGDAAHAMLPFHAQGAVQSIEDAWVLARCLQRGRDNLPTALLRYEQLRRDRATRVQQQSRAAEHTFHMSDANELKARNARFEQMQAKAANGFPRGQQWLFSYDAEQAVLGQDQAWQSLSW